MNRHFNIHWDFGSRMFIWMAALLLFITGSLGVAASAAPAPDKQVLFLEGTDGFTLYRIPGIIVTAKGTALAYCEARKFTNADRGEIEIHLRRSTDGGRTWSPPKQVAHLGPRLPRNPHMSASKLKKDMGGPNEQTVNNAVAIADRNGAVHLIYCVEYMRSFYIRSDDDGLTWTKPTEITYAFDQFRSDCDWQVIATGPGHGIQLSNGRLVVPFWMTTYEKDAPLRGASAVIFSDDGGTTWQRGDVAIPNGGESIAAELSDDRVIITARNGDPSKRRAIAFSDDGATGWSKTTFAEELLEPGCMAGLVSHPGTTKNPKPFLLFSNPHTTLRDHQDRKELMIKASYDDGRTWPVNQLLQQGPAAYSDLAVLPDGTILCFYESGEPIVIKRKRDWAYSSLTLARIHPDWLTNKKTSGQ